jgi:Glycosyl transferase family 11
VIVVRLSGGLGNQMFQYAAGRSLAERRGVELVLDSSWTEEIGRPYKLGCFDLGVRVCPVWEVARVPNTSRPVRLIQRIRPSRRPFVTLVAEELSTNRFDPAVLTASDFTYLCGYWQFEPYFSEHADAIRSAFGFPALSAESEQIAERIRSGTAVSVHVRRGDYTDHAHLGFLDDSYFHRAVETISRSVPHVELFVFSDDPAWCAQNLRFAVPSTVVERPLEPDRDWEDMRLMSMCRHHVIANSTYGWWGAWLNPSASKLVVAPKKWVQNEKRVGDPVPAGWIRV